MSREAATDSSPGQANAVSAARGSRRTKGFKPALAGDRKERCIQVESVTRSLPLPVLYHAPFDVGTRLMRSYSLRRVGFWELEVSFYGDRFATIVCEHFAPFGAR
jgi:hypothetical protein